MSAADAFAAVALAAVCWDGVLSMAGSRSLRHALDYRMPFRDYDEAQMMQLLDSLLKQLREKGAQHLMVDGAAMLNARQRGAAFAVAAEIMRSDGPLQDDEQNILINLAAVLELDSALSSEILRVMDILHAEIECEG
ncbi:tellurite resistance TerB family protein [Synechococcus sp. CBW1108]|uniref:tellurite resistance TerB family protein n=1 Tax=Synechococcus sp. CBW1108 TaxID=1353147 RepID=UPI0018CDF8C8|nr:tellurite resistance TerB family protein [Synechococcus sp. CBW1108]QPN70420.1 tellurite resistance TerB family protein [Synechococcus sp. CBW1108]